MKPSPRSLEDSAQPEFITSADIAAEFGVARPAVSNWRRRYGPDSPTPVPHPMQTTRYRCGDGSGGRRSTRGIRLAADISRAYAKVRARADALYLSIQDIADRLDASASAVRQWLRKTWPIPFPAPDTTDTEASRTLLRWHADRLPDIQRWREWHLHHLATRSTPKRPTAPDTDQGNDQGIADHTSAKSALPSPAHYLRDPRSTVRSGVRQGRIVRPSVQRRVR